MYEIGQRIAAKHPAKNRGTITDNVEAQIEAALQDGRNPLASSSKEQIAIGDAIKVLSSSIDIFKQTERKLPDDNGALTTAKMSLNSSATHLADIVDKIILGIDKQIQRLS